MPVVPYVSHGQPSDHSYKSKEMMIIVRKAITAHMWKIVNE
jgi:hypothetical protein